MNKPLLKKGHNLIPHDSLDAIYDVIDESNLVVELYESKLFKDPTSLVSLTFHYVWHGRFTQSEGIEIKYINSFFDDENSTENNYETSTHYKRIIKE